MNLIYTRSKCIKDDKIIEGYKTASTLITVAHHCLKVDANLIKRSLQFGNFKAESEAVAFSRRSSGATLFPVSFHSIGRVGRMWSLGSGFDPSQRARVVVLLELGSQTAAQEIDSCPTDMVDHMPCEDPRINSQLSREMKYYMERYCPKPEEMPLSREMKEILERS
ncbi:Methyltransferase [Forsythia ovata]|uniref:Methyltransferase n=1 Tax=Forsythia ovata TaxID=205694 RepID=A0ABD1UTB6_9LAMI